MWWCYVILLLTATCVSRYSSLLNDYVALEVPLIFDNTPSTTVFRLMYSELGQWRSIAEQYSELYGIPKESFVNSIAEKLELKKYHLQYPAFTMDSHISINSISAHMMNWHRAHGSNDYFLSIRPGAKRLNSHASQDFVSDMLNANDKFVQRLPEFLLRSTDIIIYQSLGVSTGGTTAMNILHSTLQRLGFRVLLCNDSNKQSKECRRPSGLVVSFNISSVLYGPP